MVDRLSQKHKNKKAPAARRVAVTGDAGSGKSVLCAYFKELGAMVISADQLAREAVRPGSAGLARIVAHFGPAVLMPDGNLDRGKLRRIIITDIAERKILERFLHPEILTGIRSAFDHADAQDLAIVVVEIPLVFEINAAHLFDVVIAVSAGRKRKIDRLITRDRVSEKQAEALLKAQLPQALKVNKAHMVIKNNGSMDQFKERAREVYKKLLKQ